MGDHIKREHMLATLTTDDVRHLTREATQPESRHVVAEKVAADYAAGRFNAKEAAIAEDIFRLLVKDAQKHVRLALAEHLSMSETLPHDVALQLAHDDKEIAAPMLEYSRLLTDNDLLVIIESSKEVLKLCAIARRQRLSEAVSHRLIGTKEEEVLSDLFLNKTAQVSEKSLDEYWDHIAANNSLLETLVHRGHLPLTIAEKIYLLVSDDMKLLLSKQYRIKRPALEKATSDVREWQMLGVIPNDGSINPDDEGDVDDLIDQLYFGGRLTHSFLMRALCVGSLGIFEAGIARLAGVPRVNARILLMDSGQLGFHAIYETAAMPPGFADAVCALLTISLEVTDYGITRHSDFRKRVIDRIYQEGYHKTIDNMPYLLSIIGGKIVPANL